jgi:hypothetical protein
VKLQEKQRIGSKIIKRHDTPTTPCDRLLVSRYISKDKKQWLSQVRLSLNPFLLQRAVHLKLKRILQECSLRPRDLTLQPATKRAPFVNTTNTNTNHHALKPTRQLLRGAHQARKNPTQQ